MHTHIHTFTHNTNLFNTLSKQNMSNIQSRLVHIRYKSSLKWFNVQKNAHTQSGNPFVNKTDLCSSPSDYGFCTKKNIWNELDTHNVDQSHAGTTLANLKKQRAQSRNSATISENGSLIGAPQSITSTNSLCSGVGGISTGAGQSMEMSLLSSTNDLMHTDPNATITKFSGVTSDVVSDSTRSRRCCIVM